MRSTAVLPTKRVRRIGSSSLLFAACALAAPSVTASTVFPQHLKSHWQVEVGLPGQGKSGCPLCHTTDPGQSGSATQKFALRLRSYGLVPGDLSSLEAALDTAKASGADSDGDGFSDYEEITLDGTNPNDASFHRIVVAPSAGASGAANEPAGTAGAWGAGGAAESCTTETVYPDLRHGCSSVPATPPSGGWLMLAALVAVACARRRHEHGRRDV